MASERFGARERRGARSKHALKDAREALCAAAGGLRHAPFANGPLEVRRRSLAARLDACAAAEALAVGATSRGDESGYMCSSTDSQQGSLVAACLPRDEALAVADMTDARVALGPCDACSRCGRGSPS